MSVAAQHLDDLPKVFGRYLLVKRLSRGGMGEIFLAKIGEIEGFEKPVIIKRILPNLGADQDFVRRFIDEAQVAIKLNHANIAPVYEVGKVAGDYFLALEYIEGRDLRRLLNRCRERSLQVPSDVALYIARELCAGLGYAHRRVDESGRSLNLVHCDISPPNLMVSFEGGVKLIDFGIAKSALRTAGSNPKIGFGKFGYMAPEQLVRGGVVDRRTDVYAAGVVLYELLTAEKLFVFPEGADYKQIARIVTKGEYVPASQRDPRLDPSIDGILARALAPRADDRYATAEEFRDDIQRKLYELNSTFSADALGHFVRGLFADELESEQALLASAKAVNVAEFFEELTGSMTHTVTFARAGLLGRLRSPSQQMAVLQATSPEEIRRRGLPLALAAVAAMILGGAVAFLWLSRHARQDASRSPMPAVAAPHAAPRVTSLVAPPTGETLVARSNDSGEPARLRGSHRLAKAVEPKPTDEPSAEPPHRADHGQVEAKFRAVKTEYDAFRGEYGARLEAQWNAIANEIAFGHGERRYERVSAMLDALRKEMARVRNGG